MIWHLYVKIYRTESKITSFSALNPGRFFGLLLKSLVKMTSDYRYLICELIKKYSIHINQIRLGSTIYKIFL